MCLVSNERRENALDNGSIQFVSILRGNEDISLIKRVSFLLGRTVIVEVLVECTPASLAHGGMNGFVYPLPAAWGTVGLERGLPNAKI